jgi:N-acetylglutamate synthase-like GNAT family acetyltransferase
MTILNIEFATPEYDETVQLRDKILRKPLGLQFSEEQLAEEFADFHLAAYTHDWVLRGCLVLTLKGDKTLKMRQVAVDEAVQKMGVGRQLVAASEAFGRAHGFDIMELNARDTAVPFYQKLNYAIVGERFEEVGIGHFKMVKKLVE